MTFHFRGSVDCYELDRANNVWSSSATILDKGRGYAAAVGGVDVNDRWWVMGGDDDKEASKVLITNNISVDVENSPLLINLQKPSRKFLFGLCYHLHSATHVKHIIHLVCYFGIEQKLRKRYNTEI